MKRFSLLLFLGAILAGCDDGKPALQAIQPPKDVADYAARRAGCNHWGGEEGYDAARRAEINRSMTSLKCGEIDRDEAALLRRYGGQPQILQRIREAHDKLL